MNDHTTREMNNVAGPLHSVVGVPVSSPVDTGSVATKETLTRTDWFLMIWISFFIVYALYCVIFEPYELTVTCSMRSYPLIVKLTVVGAFLLLVGHWWWR